MFRSLLSETVISLYEPFLRSNNCSGVLHVHHSVLKKKDLFSSESLVLQALAENVKVKNSDPHSDSAAWGTVFPSLMYKALNSTLFCAYMQ